MLALRCLILASLHIIATFASPALTNQWQYKRDNGTIHTFRPPPNGSVFEEPDANERTKDSKEKNMAVVWVVGVTAAIIILVILVANRRMFVKCCPCIFDRNSCPTPDFTMQSSSTLSSHGPIFDPASGMYGTQNADIEKFFEHANRDAGTGRRHSGWVDKIKPKKKVRFAPLDVIKEETQSEVDAGRFRSLEVVREEPLEGDRPAGPMEVVVRVGGWRRWRRIIGKRLVRRR
ncbi:hypothetical protein BJ508DRAFT_109484 [Ascobolus immersus RN42]|uniref:Uncharacterized protein n=1 Tax=Ascobolus immersus RN42 TaxID=1160509 RepID=A0A3N4I6G1_ASCIM|nr:hypothetical protein BJ508DRAFT_109484 [Ascobolus immersus RN42]